jgi:hypothetical protein
LGVLHHTRRACTMHGRGAGRNSGGSLGGGGGGALTACMPTASCVGCRSSTRVLNSTASGGSLMPLSSTGSVSTALSEERRDAVDTTEVKLCTFRGGDWGP